jgi:hypothetical protein
MPQVVVVSMTPGFHFKSMLRLVSLSSSFYLPIHWQNGSESVQWTSREIAQTTKQQRGVANLS